MRAILLICLSMLLTGCEDSSTEPPRDGRARLLWTQSDPAGGRAQPYADAEHAVFTTGFDTRVVGVDSRTGRRLWERRLTGGPAHVNLPFANILGFENLAIVAGWDLYAFDRATGTLRWKFAPEAEYPAAASIAIEGDRIFSPGATGLYAVDASTGTQLWRTELNERPFALVVDQGVVYLGTRGFIGDTDVLGAGHALAVRASDGQILWRVPIPDEPGTSWIGGINMAGALTPELFIVASMNSRVYGIERTTGQIRWQHRGPGPYQSGVAVLDSVAVAASLTGEIVRLDARTGEVRWRTTTGGSSVDDQLVAGEHCVFITVGGLMCVDAGGKLLWDHGGQARGGPSYESPVRVLGDRLFIGSIEGFHALLLPQ